MAHQPSLPRFPVPALEATVSKLVKSAKPLAKSQDELEELSRKAQHFLTDENQGPLLQRRLQERAQTQRNWSVLPS